MPSEVRRGRFLTPCARPGIARPFQIMGGRVISLSFCRGRRTVPQHASRQRWRFGFRLELYACSRSEWRFPSFPFHTFPILSFCTFTVTYSCCYYACTYSCCYLQLNTILYYTIQYNTIQVGIDGVWIGYNIGYG